MHSLFSDWIRIVDKNPTEDSLNKRWAGIEKVVESIDEESCFDVVRIFLGKPTKSSGFIDTFRESFKEADPTFRMSKNDLELKVLAGISIIISLEEDNNDFNTAMAVVCANFQGVTSIIKAPPVINIAEQYLKDQAIGARSIKNNFNIHYKDFKQQKDTLVSLLPQNNLAATQPSITALLDKTQDIFKELENSLIIQQEESNMLWWVTGEYSNTLNKKMSQLPLPFACLIVAEELKGMTKLLPGPLSIPALMDKIVCVGRNNNRELLSIKEVVNGAPKEWSSKYIGNIDLSPIEDLCPLHYAINKSIEAGNQTAWIPIFEKNVGVKADHKFTPVEIAMQAYNEMLLINNIG